MNPLLFYTFVVFEKYEQLRAENEWETVPGGTTPRGGAGPLLAAPPHGVGASEPVSDPFSPGTFLLL